MGFNNQIKESYLVSNCLLCFGSVMVFLVTNFTFVFVVVSI
jgi:hypothetical protein